MLPIEKISHTAIYGDIWKKERRGKITASKYSCLVGEKSHEGKFTQTAISYIQSLAGEIVTGLDSQEEILTEDIAHGISTEPESIEYFLQQTGLFALRNEASGDTHRFIKDDEYSGCTPDILISKGKDVNKLFNLKGDKIDVTPAEGKCPKKFHRFIKLFNCKTPDQLKKIAPEYYYQVCKQMHSCESLNGFFYAYNKLFPIKMRIIEFRKLNLIDDFKKMEATLHYAKLEIEKQVNILKQG